MNSDSRADVLWPWYQPFYISDEGWVDRYAVVFVPQTNTFATAQIVVEAPNELSFMLSVTGSASDKFQLGAGQHVLTISLLAQPPGTQIELADTSPDGSGKQSFRVLSVTLVPTAVEHPLSVATGPLENTAGTDAIQAVPLHESIKKFRRKSVSMNVSDNVQTGSKIKIGSRWLRSIFPRKTHMTNPLKPLRASESGNCFLVAAGPSVKGVDLNRLAGSRIIGVNGAAALLQQYPIRFSHYMVVDPYFAYYKLTMVAEAIKSGTPCFFSREVITMICGLDPDLLTYGNIHLIGFAKLDREAAAGDDDFVLGERTAGFSKNLEKGYMPGGTVAYTALQAIRYLGFNRVCMLGVDLSAGAGQYRFYDNEDEARLVKLYTENLERGMAIDFMPAFGTLGKLIDDPEEDFQVFNLSAMSRIPTEFVPKITLKEALRREFE